MKLPHFWGLETFLSPLSAMCAALGLVCRYLLSGEELFKDDLLRAPTQHFKLSLFRTVLLHVPSILGRQFLAQDYLSLQKLKF